MATYTHIDNEEMHARKFKYCDAAKFEGPGWYNKDTGLKDEPPSKEIGETSSAGIVSGRPLKPPGEFNSLLKEMKKKVNGYGINTY